MPKKNPKQEQYYQQHVACHLCGYAIPGDLVAQSHPLFGTIDHIQPRSLGGSDAVANRAPAHRLCNELRDTKAITEELKALCRERIVPVFESCPRYIVGKELRRRIQNRKKRRRAKLQKIGS